MLHLFVYTTQPISPHTFTIVFFVLFQILQTVSARSESLKPLRPNEMVTFECLNCLADIIGNANNKAGLVLQCLHILTNLGENWSDVR